MTRSDSTSAIVRRVLGTVLGREIDESENPSRATEPAWDSLNHIEIVLSLESALDIRYTEAELAELTDLRRIIAVSEGRRVAT